MSAKPQTITWSQIGTTDRWQSSDGRIVRHIEGTEFIAGPFATPEEAHKAMELLSMEPAGRA